MTPIAPPAAIGVLGGGQLGRYAVVAARQMGYRTVVVDPDPSAPAGRLADEHVVAPYDDPVAVDRLSACAAVTTEFENPPASVLETLATRTVVAPSAHAVAICQDRIAEKRFLTEAGIRVGPHATLDVSGPLSGDDVRYPAILKTARLGYDGKGQRTVVERTQLGEAHAHLGMAACVLEQQLVLDAEVSVVLARSSTGETSVFDVAENHHVDGILDLTVVPARVDAGIAEHAVGIARQIAAALDYVGVLAVELFVTGGDVLVNELAPRPHNSGHWTLDAARTSQFDQQVRAMCGAGLGDPTRTAPAVAMVNLLGDLWAGSEPDWGAVLADADARLHLYGKSAARPGRKMGHLTVLGDRPADVAATALELRRAVTRG